MTAQDVAAHLGHRVRFKCARLYVDGIYTLTAYILRRDRSGHKIASVELTDDHNRIVIAPMGEIEVITDDTAGNEGAACNAG